MCFDLTSASKIQVTKADGSRPGVRILDRLNANPSGITKRDLKKKVSRKYRENGFENDFATLLEASAIEVKNKLVFVAGSSIPRVSAPVAAVKLTRATATVGLRVRVNDTFPRSDPASEIRGQEGQITVLPVGTSIYLRVRLDGETNGGSLFKVSELDVVQTKPEPQWVRGEGLSNFAVGDIVKVSRLLHSNPTSYFLGESTVVGFGDGEFVRIKDALSPRTGGFFPQNLLKKV